MINNSLPLLDNIISNIKTLTEDIVVKYSSKANKYETVAYTKAFDYYYLAINKLDSFSSYPSYSEEALRAAGINVDKEVMEYLADKSKIPEYIRNKVVEAQRFITIRDFEEKNDYYRQYIGLPNLDDTDFFYVDEDTSIQTGISTDIPIHKLTDVDISILSGVGYISKLIQENPKHTYLQYLGSSRLDLYRIRSANNLSIIKINKVSVPDKLFEEFMTCYEQSREYFMNAVFIKEYAAMYEYYENLMGFLVMVNTIKMVMTKIFKNGIDRDFYDLVSIVKMFNAYNIPYISEFTLEQQRIILRNINNLIRIKSTDKVLIEICSLLCLGDIDIFRYYLVKKHKRDEATGKPIFRYKTNPLGAKVLDKEQMYNVNFSKVNIKEKNIGLALTKAKNELDYEEVTNGDPYWWQDDELKSIIYDNEFNFMETKYISFQLMYKMSNVIFEQIYFLSMLHDRKDEMSNISLLLPRIDFNREISLFDTCILLFALTCKANKMKGNIIYEPTKVANVLGFNFNLDLKPILDSIRNDPTINDPELIDYVKGMSLSSIEDVNTLYGKIKGFREYIEEKMFLTNDKDTYAKYKTIYNTFMTTDTMGELFRLPDGDIASTYAEYLMYNNYELYELLQVVHDEQINELVNHIISKLCEYCTNLKYLHLTGVNVNGTINAIWTLVNFFKSYTVDIQQFNIVYLIDGRIENMIKLMDTASIKSTNYLDDNMNKPILYDTLQYRGNIYIDSSFKLTCRSQYHSYLRVDDNLIIKTLGKDSLNLVKVRLGINSDLKTIDTLKESCVVIENSEKLPIADTYKYFSNLHLDGTLGITDKIMVSNSYDISMDLNLGEKAYVAVHIYESDDLNILDKAKYVCTIYSKEDLNLEEFVCAQIKIYLRQCQLSLYDTIKQYTVVIENPERLPIEDQYKVFMNMCMDDKINPSERIKCVSNIDINNELKLTERHYQSVDIYTKDMNSMVDKTNYVCSLINYDSDINLIDWMQTNAKIYLKNCEFRLYDSNMYRTNMSVNSNIVMYDKIRIVYN